MDNFQWGASHSVPITLSLPPMGPLQVSSVSYRENWYQQRQILRWNPVDGKIDTTIRKGMFTARDMSFSWASAPGFSVCSVSTGKAMCSHPHEIRPSISINYKPNMNRSELCKCSGGCIGKQEKVLLLWGSVYGPFSEGRFGGFEFRHR